MSEGTVLVVDDDKEIRALITVHLESEHLKVHQADSGAGAIRKMKERHFDVVVLDIMMEETNGFDVLQWMRSSRLDTPVILLSARWEDESKVHGFGIGADDYVTKPFSILEFVARVKAHLRRSISGGASFQMEALSSGSLTLHPTSQLLYKNQQPIALTTIETQLLYTLMKQPNRVITKAKIYSSVWGHESYDDTSLTVYISYIRKKIEDDPHNPQYIQTVRGLGYRFNGRHMT